MGMNYDFSDIVKKAIFYDDKTRQEHFRDGTD